MLKISFIKTHWYQISIGVILVVAVFLRFVSYENRWGLAYDQAHDILVARHAIESQKLPLLGPFSSAGPFQTGGEWYWFIMVGSLLNFNNIMTPWIFLTSLYVVFVFLIIKLGTKLIDKKFGILVGILAAVSTAQLAQGVNLTNQSPLSLTSILALLSMVSYVQTKKLLYLFFLGFFVSLSAVIHLQGVSLILLVLMTLVMTGIPSLKTLLTVFLGLLIPTLPIIIFDIQNNFLNIRGMIQYYLVDQYKVSLDVLGRRWLTYISVFWVNAFGHIIGGSKWMTYLVIPFIVISFFVSFLKKTITKEWRIIILSFICMVFVLRYIRTPLFDSYLVFLHPFILLITAFGIYFIYKKNKWIGVLLCMIVVSCTLVRDIDHIQKSQNFSSGEAIFRRNFLEKKYGNTKFSLYSYKYKWVDKNLALSMYLDEKNLIDDKAGRRIGIVVATTSGEFKQPILQGDETGYQLLDLQASSAADLIKHGFLPVNPSNIYIATQEWYNYK